MDYQCGGTPPERARVVRGRCVYAGVSLIRMETRLRKVNGRRRYQLGGTSPDSTRGLCPPSDGGRCPVRGRSVYASISVIRTEARLQRLCQRRCYSYGGKRTRGFSDRDLSREGTYGGRPPRDTGETRRRPLEPGLQRVQAPDNIAIFLVEVCLQRARARRMHPGLRMMRMRARQLTSMSALASVKA